MIKDDKGIFPFAILFYLVGGIIFIFFFIFFMKQIILFIIVIAIVIILVSFARGKMKASTKSTPIIVVFIVIVLLALAIGSVFIFSIPLMVWEPDFSVNTDTVEGQVGWGKVGAGTTIWKHYTYLDGTRYTTSMYNDRVGQTIGIHTIVELENEADLGWSCIRTEIGYYRVFIETKANDWIEITNDPERMVYLSGPIGESRMAEIGTGEIRFKEGTSASLGAATFGIKGEVVGAVKVNFYGKYKEYNCILGGGSWGNYYSFSEDVAYLNSGLGSVNVIGIQLADGTYLYDEDTAEEGGKVIIHIECGAGAWEVRIAKYRQIETNYELVQSLTAGCTQDIEWTIPKGAFTPSQDPLENQYIVRLYNSVIQQSKDDFFTIDKFDYIPPKPEATLNKNYAIVGDDIIVTMTGKSNEITDIPIGAFKIDLWYGQSKPGTEFADYWIADNVVIQNVYEVDNNTYGATYTFKAHKAGTISGEVRSIDTDGRASSSTKIKINAYWSEDDPPFNEKYGIDWSLIILILIIVFSIIIAYVLLKKKRGK